MGIHQGMLKKEPETNYLYIVLNDTEVLWDKGKECEKLRSFQKGDRFEVPYEVDNPSLKFLYRSRNCFFPKEIVEINELGRSYGISFRAGSHYEYRTHIHKEVVKYIPIWDDILNWFNKKFRPTKVKIIETGWEFN